MTISPVPSEQSGNPQSSLSSDLINTFLSNLKNGDHSVFKHVAVVQAFPVTIGQLLDQKNEQDVDILMGQLVAVLQGEDDGLRDNAAIALAGVLNVLVSHEKWMLMDRLLPATQQTLHIIENDTEIVKQCIQSLTRLAAHHIRDEQYSAARIILIIINGPVTLASANNDFCELAGSAVRELALRPVLDKLLEEYLHGEEKQDEASRLLVAFGVHAADFLMDSLGQGENKTDRLKLLKLAEEIGEPMETALRRILQQTNPWYVTRNIIRLLGKSGNQDCFEEIAPFLDHDNIRVKQEVLTATAKIGGSSRKSFLLKALHSVPPQLTGHVISLLGEIPGDSLVVPLADLLEVNSIYQNRHGEELQISICEALGKIGSVKALPILKKVIALNTRPAMSKEDIEANLPLMAARNAVTQIGKGSKQIHQTKVKKVMGLSLAADHVSTKEAAIIRLAMSGDKKKAVRQLYELIGECAANNDIQNAERLRERYYEIAPTALNAIIRSGELIEQVQGDFIGRGFLDIWKKLRKSLSNAEFGAIYHELENRSLRPDELLVRQGSNNDKLFFINHGSLKVFYKQGQHEIFVKSLTCGEIAGENFFQSSIWTVGLRALTPSRVSILKRSSFNRWHNEFPGLKEKLQGVYNRSDDVHDLLNKKGLSRRKYERYQLSRKVHMQMIDEDDKEIGSEFSGDLFNISTGGLALRIRVTKKDRGRLFQDKNMRIDIPVGGDTPPLTVQGLVLAVHPFNQDLNDYLIHLIFDTQLNQKSLQLVLG
jgi:HEAT repeat protein/CRP-like cAMP-binding protein